MQNKSRITFKTRRNQQLVEINLSDTGDNFKRAVHDCLFSWRNRHSGSVSRTQLSDALRKASKEKGLIPADCANFLSGIPHVDSGMFDTSEDK